MFYNLVRNERGTSLSLMTDEGVIFGSISNDHPRFTEIRDYLLNTPEDEHDENWLRRELNIVVEVGARLARLSERVTLRGNTLYFDGDEIRDSIAEHILRFFRDNDERGYAPLVRFLEKVQQNPSDESRESLYAWLSNRDFTINTDGDFVAYKGVRWSGSENDVPVSVHHGFAIVDGVAVNGPVPNKVGSVIEMPRSMVDGDRSVGCSFGLHAGTWEYASSFGQGGTLVVLINPRDVVSVPSDCNFQKLRVSRYRVTDVREQPIESWGAAYLDNDFEDYDTDGYDAEGYDADGYDTDGYDRDGYDENGYDADGYDTDGFDRDGYDRDGYDENGYDENGYDADGYDQFNLDRQGYVRRAGVDASAPALAGPADGPRHYYETVKDAVLEAMRELNADQKKD